MKQLTKAVLGLIAAVAMLFTGLVAPVTALADGEETVIPAAETSYTITPPENNTHTYEVYQIFTGDLSQDKNGNKVLSNVKWGQNGKNGTDTITVGGTVPESVLNELKNASGDDQAKLDVIKKYVDLTGEAFKEVKTAAVSDVPAGYYLIKDKNGSVSDKDDTYTLYVVQVVGNVTITPKGEKPKVEKFVKDINDSTDTSEGNWDKTADHDGWQTDTTNRDAINFRLEGTLPSNYSDYTSYTYKFTDTISAGLTYNAGSVKVYVENTGEERKDVTGQFTVTGPTEYTPTDTNSESAYQPIGDAKAHQLIILNNDLKQITGVNITKDSKIVVEYTAYLNDNAKIGSAGNPNKVDLTYSNNPNNAGEGETGKTPEDEVIVFTYEVVVDKTDQDHKPLEGAVFKLEKKKQDGTWETVGTVTTQKNDDGTKALGSFKRLDDGHYRLSEEPMEGYNQWGPQEFDITATHSKDTDGAFSLTLNSTFGTPNSAAGTVTAAIQNKKGSELPETGGIGTTILYVAGAACVIAAGVWFGLRRRNSVR